MFQVDVMSRTPIYEQLISQMEKFILTGTLAEGEQIPSVRSLSVKLSINHITILKAYNDVASRGLIHSVPGKGYFVSEGARQKLSGDKRELLDELRRISEELSLAGISRDDAHAVIDSVYDAVSQN
ncbi:MAG: GntR family transcriptional regulator [Clostridia bacterium]|nr:GntR family transcriptional regulator [Clostridia bacterium]